MGERTCRWPGCDSPVHALGFCNRDAQRARREGNLSDPWTTWAPKRVRPPVCEWPGCSTAVRARCLCATHYSRACKVGAFDRPWELWREQRTCEWCGGGFEIPTHRETRCCSFECSTKLWKQENPERVRLHSQEAKFKRRARLREAPHESFTVADVRLRHGDDCYLCDERINFKLKWPHPQSPSLDHVVPLARGGRHALENVAMTHLACNLSKATKAALSEPRPTLLL